MSWLLDSLDALAGFFDHLGRELWGWTGIDLPGPLIFFLILALFLYLVIGLHRSR